MPDANQPRPPHKRISGHALRRYEVEIPPARVRQDKPGALRGGGSARRRYAYRCECRRPGTDYGTGSESDAARKHSAHLDKMWAEGKR